MTWGYIVRTCLSQEKKGRKEGEEEEEGEEGEERGRGKEKHGNLNIHVCGEL